MITCRLKGGLGNQMFQIATTYTLALKNNDSCCFNFNHCHTPLQGNSSNKYKDSILSKVNNSDIIIERVGYTEPKFSYDELPYANGLVLDGYFQSEKYFKEYRNEIIDLFPINTKNVINFINGINLENKQITSVHIRRGDYLSNPEIHSPCSIEYYNKSIKYIGSSIFIFISDDIEWVKENFISDNFYYSPFNDELDDLALMVSSDNNIIANSSFSWWGAWLNRNNKKKVIAPKQWFGPLGSKEIYDIIPENWIKI